MSIATPEEGAITIVLVPPPPTDCCSRTYFKPDGISQYRCAEDIGKPDPNRCELLEQAFAKTSDFQLEQLGSAIQGTIESSLIVNYSSSGMNQLTTQSGLAEVLFTTTQQRLLGLLYGEPERSFYLKEILRLTGMGVATIKRELDRMVEVGILTRTHVGNQHHYQADPSCPIHAELAAIVRKTLGLADNLRVALAPLADRITWAFIFGSMARGTGSRGSDVDLMVVGDLLFDELSVALYPAQETIKREINPKLYRPAEWLELVSSDDPFVRNVLGNPRIDLIGKSP